MGCLQSKDANALPAPEEYLKSRASPDISVSQKNSRRFVAHRSRDRGVAATDRDHVRVPRGLAQELDGSIESRFMKLTDEKGETA